MRELSLIRLVIGTSFLLVASLKDLKTRRVPDELWIIMGSIAMGILGLELLLIRKVNWQYFLIFIPIVVIFLEAFIDRPPLFSDGRLNPFVLGWLTLPLIVFIYMINVFGSDVLFWSLTMILAVMLFSFILYFFYILHGGADAKAVITLAILLPFYPEIPGLTNHAVSPEVVSSMEIFFPFTLIILLNASLIVLIFPVVNFILNMYKGDLDIPKMFFGYKKSVSKLEDSFVWPMEYYEDGRLKTELFPRSGTDERIESLKQRDMETVWVTPKIPFILPISIGFIMSFIIGNPILYLM
ncbi:MAG: prepilin peptidase [Candidatus Thermoplasmatota archaeon]|nr:prepilin peptidase [Candidatus Thermoplasmatota archaeon]MBS3789696.1 prepilin peptidase [Candidatus Thermoplasmatota archaeon]